MGYYTHCRQYFRKLFACPKKCWFQYARFWYILWLVFFWQLLQSQRSTAITSIRVNPCKTPWYTCNIIALSWWSSPVFLNQSLFSCRPTMYSLLATAGIETPRHAILLRDENTGEPINTRFVETDDSVQVGDMVFHKPFVEKPVNAEDHNVYIYFPSSAGGGSQRLFRKVGNRSSVYSAESSVRKEGSYIYEDFVVTDGTDVKVWWKYCG